MTSELVERWMLRHGGASTDTLELNLRAMLAATYPDQYPLAASTTASVLSRIGSADLAPLARHSPSLAGYDWANYLECSLCRVVRESCE